MVQICSMVIMQRMALIKWTYESPFDKLDSQRKCQKLFLIQKCAITRSVWMLRVTLSTFCNRSSQTWLPFISCYGIYIEYYKCNTYIFFSIIMYVCMSAHYSIQKVSTCRRGTKESLHLRFWIFIVWLRTLFDVKCLWRSFSRCSAYFLTLCSVLRKTK